jgi:hypothetical protein
MCRKVTDAEIFVTALVVVFIMGIVFLIVQQLGP